MAEIHAQRLLVALNMGPEALASRQGDEGHGPRASLFRSKRMALAWLPGTTLRVDDVTEPTHWELEGRRVELLALLAFVDPSSGGAQPLVPQPTYIRQAPVGGRLAVGMLPRELGELGAQPFRGAGVCKV